MEINTDNLNFIFSIIKERSGISLTAEKTYLLDSRLLPIIKRVGLQSVTELIEKVRKTRDEQLINDIIDAITTNESSFYRDVSPFKKLNEVIIPNIIAKYPDKKKIRIWCAACSTGQEPYSIAMNIKDNFANLKVDFEIVASDISNTVLEKARNGIYTQFEIQRGLPINTLLKYFTQIKESWQINQELRSMVNFIKQNLMENFNHLGTFDIIFCRNVLIYFNTETKVKVLSNISNLLKEDGVLFLGTSESLIGLGTPFKLHEDRLNGVYILKDIY